MVKKFLLAILFVLSFISIGYSQSSWPPPFILTAPPSGACGPGLFAVNMSANSLYFCGTQWNQVTGGSGGGFINWSQNAITGTVIGQPVGTQDATTLTILGSLNGSPTQDIFNICSNNGSGGCGTKYFWIGPTGSIGWLANAGSLGTVNQSTASYWLINGGIAASAYYAISSAALPSPAQPIPTTATTGGTITANTYNFKITYNNGPTNQYFTAASSQGSITTTGTTSTITIPAPPQLSGASAWSVYEEDPSHGIWVLEGTYSTFTNVTLTSINYSTVQTPPTSNNTGGQYNTYISSSPGINGLVCISPTVPGYDCSAGTYALTSTSNLGTNPLNFNWSSGNQISTDSLGNLSLINTTPATSGNNTISSSISTQSDYYSGGIGTNTSTWTVHSYVTSGGVATRSISQTGYTGASQLFWSTHYTSTSVPMFDFNSDTNSSVVGLSIATTPEGFIRASTAGNVIISGVGAGSTYLAYDSGTGGTKFGNGAQVIIASLDTTGFDLLTDTQKFNSGTSTVNNDVRGVLNISAATSVSFTFPSAYTNPPVCVLTPISNPGTTTWWVTTTATAITANISASGTLSFNYMCTGAPN